MQRMVQLMGQVKRNFPSLHRLLSIWKVHIIYEFGSTSGYCWGLGIATGIQEKAQLCRRCIKDMVCSDWQCLAVLLSRFSP